MEMQRPWWLLLPVAESWVVRELVWQIMVKVRPSDRASELGTVPREARQAGGVTCSATTHSIAQGRPQRGILPGDHALNPNTALAHLLVFPWENFSSGEGVLTVPRTGPDWNDA